MDKKRQKYKGKEVGGEISIWKQNQPKLSSIKTTSRLINATVKFSARCHISKSIHIQLKLYNLD